MSRKAALAVTAFCCGLAAGIAALYGMSQSLDPNDGAYGLSVFQLLMDPLVFIVWLPCVVVVSFLGFVDSLWTLEGVDLKKATPVVVVSVVAAALATARFALLAGLAALVVGLLATRLCRWLFPPVPVPVDRRAELEKALAGIGWKPAASTSPDQAPASNDKDPR